MPRTAVGQVRSLECYGGIAKAFRHNTAQDNGCIHKSNQNRRKKKYVSFFFSNKTIPIYVLALFHVVRSSTFDSRKFVSFILHHDHGIEQEFVFPLCV